MKKILLVGATGQVGQELQRTLTTLGPVIVCGRSEFDLSNPKQMIKQIRRYAPTVIVNAAAYTAVDRAENESDLAFQVNGVAPGIMAEEAKRIGALLVHYSTDYVFDGSLKRPYTEEDTTNPLNVYGKSKLAGEVNIQSIGGRHLILRTSWVYGWYGQNYLPNMLKLAKSESELKMVNDQIGAPTWGYLLAECTAQMMAILGYVSQDSQLCGLYHLSGAGQTSRYGLAEAIFKDLPKKPKLIPIATGERIVPAKRPAYSVLSNAKFIKAFGLAMPSWEQSLKLCLHEQKHFQSIV